MLISRTMHDASLCGSNLLAFGEHTVEHDTKFAEGIRWRPVLWLKHLLCCYQPAVRRV